jgi:tetraprenyl-beta-curcumene synthase
MPKADDRLLTTRTTAALILANLRYWRTVASLARAQLERWTRHAERIPDPTLQHAALTNLREEGFNAQATATLATLAPRRHRRATVEAIVALQVIYDYLDSLVERTLDSPLADGRQLYRALHDAVTLDAPPRGDYYPHTHPSNDDGYLKALVSTVRAALTQLPRHPETANASKRAARRCAEAQVVAHAVPALTDAQLEAWATENAAGTELGWLEFLAGAVSSTLALHALVAAAADPRTTSTHADAVDRLYLSIAALTTLLDCLIDHEQDVQNMGHAGYTRYYHDDDALAHGLSTLIRQAVDRARDVPNRPHHLMTLAGVVAYYASAPTASAQPRIAAVRRDIGPTVIPPLTIMRTWRTAKRLRQWRQSTSPTRRLQPASDPLAREETPLRDPEDAARTYR